MANTNSTDLTVLVTAAQAKTTAAGAPVTKQLQAVAYAINSAAACGECETYFNQPLLSEVKSQLESKGYLIVPVGKAEPDRVTLISWK